MKIAYIDVETTGVVVNIHCIHQVACIIEIDGFEMESFELKMKPHPDAQIDVNALSVSGVSESLINSYEHTQQSAKDEFERILSNYVDQYDKTDKFHFIGYNSRGFDEPFVRMWFRLCESNYYGSWFWSMGIDVAVLAAQTLIHRRHHMKNFKLSTVAREMGVSFDESKTHDALYDVEKTKDIYKLITE